MDSSVLGPALENRQVKAGPVELRMEPSTCIGLFIGLYFDHKELCIKEVKK